MAALSPVLFTLSLHDALPISDRGDDDQGPVPVGADHVAQVGQVQLDVIRSEEHTSELQSRENLVCRLLLEKKNCNNLSLGTNLVAARELNTKISLKCSTYLLS